MHRFSRELIVGLIDRNQAGHTLGNSPDLIRTQSRARRIVWRRQDEYPGSPPGFNKTLRIKLKTFEQRDLNDIDIHDVRDTFVHSKTGPNDYYSVSCIAGRVNQSLYYLVGAIAHHYRRFRMARVAGDCPDESTGIPWRIPVPARRFHALPNLFFKHSGDIERRFILVELDPVRTLLHDILT